MFEMVSRLRQLLNLNLEKSPNPTKPVAPPASSLSDSVLSTSTEWPSIIWAYCQSSFWPDDVWTRRGSDRSSKECDDRGLAFGQLRVLETQLRRVKLGFLGEQKISQDQATKALKQAITEAGLNKRLTLRGGFMNEIRAELINKDDPLPAINCYVSREGKQSLFRAFLSLGFWGPEGLRDMEAPSLEALKILVRTAELLGFQAGAKHYAHESRIPIEDIIVYAVRWEDPKSGCRYLDVLLYKDLVKHQVYYGSNCSFKYNDHAFTGEVLACKPGGDWWPKMSINNCPVYASIASEPTRHMLKAKERFTQDSVQKCSYCENLATRQFRHVRFEMEDTFGSTSIGGSNYTCDDVRCIDKAKEVTCIRTEESPYTQEVWA